MTIDKYTKAVLTLIAVALWGLLFKDVPVVSTAHAVLGRETIDVNISEIGGQNLFGKYLPVEERNPVIR
jgi:hypothetical protein